MIVRLRFRTPQRPARFLHPVDPAPRTAILAPGFEQTNLIRVFAAGWNERAARFRPASIAAGIDLLRELARTGLVLDHSVVAFTRESEPGLATEDRDLFWRAFGVPVYEQVLGANNRLLASECEAHAGLHIVTRCAGFKIETEPCPCGNAALRVVRSPRIHELAEMLA